MDSFAHINPNKNWVSRFKLYHIPFWFAYHYMWWVVTVGNPFKAANMILFTPFGLKFSFYVIFQAICVYFNLYYLIPKYLEKSRFAIYLTYLLLTMLCISLCIVSGYYITAFVYHTTVTKLFGDGACSFYFFSEALPSTFASTTLAMSIKLTKNWIQSKRRQQLLETEKLETELKFLKYQFNPHFLFNTINSIFFLIHKNPDMASDSLAKFSELLRHQLYECNDTQIPLAKEIAYLENFIELEKLRQNKNVGIIVYMNHAHAGHIGIAPFILMNFVENAFKHVSKHTDKPNWIKIQLTLIGFELRFAVANSSSQAASTTDVVNFGGIGLKNVQRRLDLLYQGQYELDIHQQENSFEIQLRLTLSELAMPQPTQKQPTLEFAV